MDTKKEYYAILSEIWKLFRTHLTTIETITDCRDAKWAQIVSDFEKVETDAPPELKRYAGEMVLLHVDELERRWRK